MGEKNLWSKVGLIVLLAGMCIWQICPPDEWFKDEPNIRLKPGIDLGGGHSMLFEIDDSGLDQAQRHGLAQRVMSVLKNRVDPKGSRNLIWRPIGNNRLEIQMPRPPKGQKEKRDAFEKARSAITKTNITEKQIRNTLKLPAQEQQAEFAKLTGKVKVREKLFSQLADTDKKHKDLNKKYQALTKSATQPATTQPAAVQLATQVDKAFVERNELIDKILDTNLNVRVLTDLLELDKGNQARIDGLKNIREQHPDLESMIDELILAHKEYSTQKGMLDDPNDLMRLLRGAGVLEFRILPTVDNSNPEMLDSAKPEYVEQINKYVEQLEKFGPRPRPGDNFQWFKLAKQEEEDHFGANLIIREYAGAKYVLSHSKKDMGLLNDRSWNIKVAYPDRDRRRQQESPTLYIPGRRSHLLGKYRRSDIRQGHYQR